MQRATGSPTQASRSPHRRPLRVRLRVFAQTLRLYAAVALGAGIGGLLRFLASYAVFQIMGAGFPWGTLAINTLGSFVIGFYATLTGPDGRLLAGSRRRHFVMTGLCGGFTTFSVFSLEALHLAEIREHGLAGLYLGASVAAWLAAVWLGFLLAARLNRLGGR